PLWERLDRECSRLDSLIGDILTLSRLDARNIPPAHFELDSLVANTLEDARFVAGDRQLRLEGATDGTLFGWSDQLASSMDNLLRNALFFTPTGEEVMVTLDATGCD